MSQALNEYEHEAVPDSARKSLFSVAVVWAGFPMVMVGAFVGAQIVTSLGFTRGMLAIITGNIVLAVYVACLSALAARQGKTFALSCREIFSPAGAKLIAVFLSGLVVGWFAVQTGLAGHGLNTLLGLPLGWSVVVVGAAFTLLSMAGMQMLKPISIISICLFIITGIISVVLNFRHHSWQQVVDFTPPSGHSLALGIGVTMAISVFVDSGTLTADFTRWSKTPSQAVIASLAAFPVANTLPMLLGGLVAATGEATDGDFAHLLTQLGPYFGIFAAVFFVINCASVATHGLYNAASGWSSVIPLSFRHLVVLLGIVGTGLALAGISNWLVNWLSLLGIIVPGIGGAIIGWMIAGWVFSIICSTICYLHAPQYSVAVVSILSAVLFCLCALPFARQTSAARDNA